MTLLIYLWFNIIYFKSPQKLIPKNCISFESNSPKYRALFLNNFLTLTDEVLLPENEIDYFTTFLLEIQGNFDKFDYVRIRSDLEVIPKTILGNELMKLFKNPYLTKSSDYESIEIIENSFIESLKKEWIQFFFFF
jgi:hypothetical protein